VKPKIVISRNPLSIAGSYHAQLLEEGKPPRTLGGTNSSTKWRACYAACLAVGFMPSSASATVPEMLAELARAGFDLRLEEEPKKRRRLVVQRAAGSGFDGLLDGQRVTWKPTRAEALRAAVLLVLTDVSEIPPRAATTAAVADLARAHGCSVAGATEEGDDDDEEEEDKPDPCPAVRTDGKGERFLCVLAKDHKGDHQDKNRNTWSDEEKKKAHAVAATAATKASRAAWFAARGMAPNGEPVVARAAPAHRTAEEIKKLQRENNDARAAAAVEHHRRSQELQGRIDLARGSGDKATEKRLVEEKHAAAEAHFAAIAESRRAFRALETERSTTTAPARR
jgi:hypothetical protein